MKYKLWYSF